MPSDNQDNYLWWQERAALHPTSAMYEPWIAALRAGGHPLRPLEVSEVGDVTGKRLLHLQCHIGTDTLGWERLGAEVTGVDFSEEALSYARNLAAELKMQATFVHSSIEGLGAVHSGQYDIVFTSYGTIGWLEDLTVWARTIEKFLVPGGFFYIADSHPIANGLSEDSFSTGNTAEFRDPYFPSGKPVIYSDSGTYADSSIETVHNRTREWPHSLSEIVMALLGCGLQLEMLHEHDRDFFPRFRCMAKDAQGDYRLPAQSEGRVPLVFSLRARKSR